ncbi:MAG: hypothetical protein ACOH1K_00045 [Rhodoglobus sp.]
MNRLAINDVIENSLAHWYRVVSEWRRPGEGTVAGCVGCRGSEFAAFDRLGEWPHDLTHSFVDTFELVSLQLAFSFHQDRHSSHDRDEIYDSQISCESCLIAAHSTVHAFLTEREGDIVDVVAQCALPRLAAYVAKTADLAVNAARSGEWTS